MYKGTHHFPRIGQTLTFVIVVLTLTGCNVLAPPPTPTSTPLPTATATETPVPTNTPTPTPTATSTNTPLPIPTDTAKPSPTQNLTATAAAVAKQTEDDVTARAISLMDEYGIPHDRGVLVYYGTAPTTITITTYNTYDSRFIYSEDAILANFILGADVTWESTSGLAGCGFIFRGYPDIENGEYYRFIAIRLSGLPAWAVDYWKFGEWQASLSGGNNTSSAIKQNQGDTNTFIIVVQGEMFTGYVNGKRLGSVTLVKLSKGVAALYGVQESGETTCTFNNWWVWQLP